jgi:hypothetical protein
MEDARQAAVDWSVAAAPSDPLVAYIAAQWSERFGLVGVG